MSEGAAALAAERGANGRGYLDLLDGELDSTGVTQDLMLTRLVPAIYERYWRPALGRVAKGPLGPGMSDERRIARLNQLAVSGEQRGIGAQEGQRPLRSNSGLEH